MEELDKEEMMGTEGGACTTYFSGVSDIDITREYGRKGFAILRVGKSVDTDSIVLAGYKTYTGGVVRLVKHNQVTAGWQYYKARERTKI